MRAGADVIYQACFVDGDWRGFADFVERQPDGRYEVVDTKLARHSKPAYVLQLCFYSEQVARIQGSLPERMHVVLGTHERESLRVADFLAYYHRVRERFVARGRGRDRRLPAAGLVLRPLRLPAALRGALARRRPPQPRRADAARPGAAARGRGHRDRRRSSRTRPTRRGRRRWRRARSRRCATRRRCRSPRARTGTRGRCSTPEPARGFELLPPPSDGDLFFDIEGDPFWEPGRGLEYLWGIVDTAGAFRPFWAHDRAQERRAVEGVIDLIRERRAADPALHVYHYAAYEVTALQAAHLRVRDARGGARRPAARRGLRRPLQGRLAGAAALARALRAQAGRDVLLRAPRRPARRRRLDRALRGVARAARPADPRRDRRLQRGGLRLDAPAARLAAAAAAGRGAAARAEGAARAARAARPRPRSCAPRSSPGLPDDPYDVADADRPRWLLAQLLLYHRREEKPVWWAFFDRIGRTSEELQERDSDAIGGLEQAGPPIGSAQSLVWPFTLPGAAAPPRRRASDVFDPATGGPAGNDRRARRGGGHALAAARPDARGRAAAGGADPRRAVRHEGAAGRAAAARPLGARRRRDATPRRKSILVREPFPAPLPQDDLEAAKELVAGLDGRHLVIQGPPGSGKTYTGARLIVHLMRLGRRVGVTATSHKAIHNLVAEVERAAREEGFAFRGLKKGDAYEAPFVTTSANQARLLRAGGRRAAARRHRLALRARGHGRRRRHAVRRRGGPGVARRRARARDVRAQRRPARRPAAARPGLAGNPSGGRGGVGARAPARRRGHGAARPRALPLAHLADAPGRLPLHLRDVVRGPAALGARRARGSGSTRPASRARGCAGCRSSTRGTAARRSRRPTGSPPSSSC